MDLQKSLEVEKNTKLKSSLIWVIQVELLE
jgi:hypothetical protein